MNNNNQITAWHLRIMQNLINCCIQFAEIYSGYFADAEFKYVKDRCNELAFQSWQVMVQNNSLFDNSRLYKYRQELETYIKHQVCFVSALQSKNEMYRTFDRTMNSIWAAWKSR